MRRRTVRSGGVTHLLHRPPCWRCESLARGITVPRSGRDAPPIDRRHARPRQRRVPMSSPAGLARAVLAERACPLGQAKHRDDCIRKLPWIVRHEKISPWNGAEPAQADPRRDEREPACHRLENLVLDAGARLHRRHRDSRLVERLGHRLHEPGHGDSGPLRQLTDPAYRRGAGNDERRIRDGLLDEREAFVRKPACAAHVRRVAHDPGEDDRSLTADQEPERTRRRRRSRRLRRFPCRRTPCRAPRRPALHPRSGHARSAGPTRRSSSR